jgi:hypothetical protein
MGMVRLALLALVVALWGCDARLLRDNQQAWREAECDKILDTKRRERCLQEARGR